MKILENVSLAPQTTIGVGGPARYFAAARSAPEICAAVDFARSGDLPLFVLGGGSNLVVADTGFQGLVLKVGIPGISHHTLDGAEKFEVGAGIDWDDFVAETVAANCAGVECLSGIPGTVGGTPVQNVGAYGQEVSETIESVRAFDTQEGSAREFRNAECGFAYRTSVFNTTERGRYIIIGVTFTLTPSGVPKIEYRDLKNHFAGRPTPTLQETREAVRQIRRGKAMLIVEGDPDCHSAGSFFKNPIVDQKRYDEVAATASKRGLTVPRFVGAEGAVKIPAAWLIENSGFAKGYTLGRAGISTKHTLAIVNRGGATAAEILALKDAIQHGVAEHFGIELKPEPVFLGFDE